MYMILGLLFWLLNRLNLETLHIKCIIYFVKIIWINNCFPYNDLLYVKIMNLFLARFHFDMHLWNNEIENLILLAHYWILDAHT